MIKEIHLKNFKCFDELKLDRLKTFNVIAGKNNFGKTSILDALFAFYGVKNPGILLNIQGFRKEITFLSSDKPFWVDYFKDSNLSSRMSIEIRDETSTIKQEYSSGNKSSTESTLSLNVDSILSNPTPLRQTLGSSSSENTLNVKVSEVENGKRHVSTDLFTISITSNGPEITGQIKQNKKVDAYEFKSATIITTSKRINKDTTITNVSTLLTQKRKEELILNLKKIDSRINDIAIISVGDAKEIYLDIGFSEMTEISMLGEGVSRALSFTSLILVQKNAVILIDEIENGIHYSAIRDIIDALITASKTNNNQVFVTTHSSDVINAINSLEDKKKDVSYIRLGRDKETSKPIVSLFDMDDFSYSVENGWEIR